MKKTIERITVAFLSILALGLLLSGLGCLPLESRYLTATADIVDIQYLEDPNSPSYSQYVVYLDGVKTQKMGVADFTVELNPEIEIPLLRFRAWYQDGRYSDLSDFTMVFKDQEQARNFLKKESVPGGVETYVKSSSTSKSGCFIATAAYGTPVHKDLDVLRAFRDEILLKNRVGQLFVKYYYRYSPTIANQIAQREWLKTVVRIGFVEPAVRIVKILR